MKQDLAYGIRELRKSPGFATVAILILALGIGANTTAFSFVNAVLLKKLPVARPQELVILRYYTNGRVPYTNFRYPVFRELERRNQVFTGMLGRAPMYFHVTFGSSATRVYGEIVSSNYFKTLGVNAVLGRTLTEEDNGAEDDHTVCVITWRLWQERFAGDPSILGRTVRLDAHPFQIVGVLQPGFRGTELQSRRDIFVPMSMTRLFMGMKRDDPGWSWLHAMGRLKPGVSRAQATASIDALAAGIESGMPWYKPNGPRSSSRLDPGEQGFDSTRENLRNPVVLSMGAVGLVLLIACTNLAGLLLSRASARNREVAVRLALGATRGRLLRQLLTECALLALAGGIASMAVSAGLIQILVRFLERSNSSTSLLVGLDRTALAFTATLAGATVLGFGLLPGWLATRMDESSGLNDRTSAFAFGAGRLRKALIVAQVALGLVLLFGAGVLTSTLRNLQTTDLGFDPERVLLVTLDPQKSGYSKTATAELFDRLLDETRKIPAVQSAALSYIGVLSSGMLAAEVRVPGYRPQEDEPNNNYNFVSAGYFRTLGMPLLAGRDFTDQDRKGAPEVAIVNEQFVAHYWPGQNVVGRRIACLGRDVEIIGVVKTAKYQRVREDPQVTIYLPLKQKPLYSTVYARSRGNPELLLARLREIVHGLDPTLPMTATTLLGERDAAISRERLLAFLSGFLAILAAVLVSIGLYGLIAYSVARRTREVGVRLALGARPRDIASLFVRECLSVVGLGIGLGLPAAFACSPLLKRPLLKSMVFAVPAWDPISMMVSVAVLVVVAVVSALAPASRGSGLDPMRALRYE